MEYEYHTLKRVFQKHYLSALSMALALTGCASHLSPTTTTTAETHGTSIAKTVSDSAPHGSRIRLFGQNGWGVVLYPGSACERSRDAIRVSGSFGCAFSSLLGTVSNESIGIPESDTTRRLSARDGIFSTAYFREYQLPSNEPTVVTMGFNDIGMRKACSTIKQQFIPEQGKDYEATLDVDIRASQCRFAINEVAPSGALTPVPTKPVESCKER